MREVLSFAIADDGVVIAPDIEKFRELKLRLLNGTILFLRTGYLAGFRTVKEALANSGFCCVYAGIDADRNRSRAGEPGTHQPGGSRWLRGKSV